MRTRVIAPLIIALALAGAASQASAAWNAQMRIFIPAQGQVVLYDNESCRGEPYAVLQLGRDYSSFVNLPAGTSGNWNDRASCIDVGPGTRLTVFQHVNYGGSSKMYGPGYYGLCGDWWNNSVSSARVTPQ